MELFGHCIGEGLVESETSKNDISHNEEQSYIEVKNEVESEKVIIAESNVLVEGKIETSVETSVIVENNENVIEENKPFLKYKEIKYGMSVLINTGNFENIRTNVEVTAELGENVTDEGELKNCIDTLRKQVLHVGRTEYREVKLKNMKKDKK